MATDIIARGMITEYKSGTNIDFKENEDGSVTISASGDVSSEDTVARDTIDNHKLDKNNPHNVTAEQVGLGNVNNTSDLDKPISTAVQTALNDKANTKHTHNKSDITDFPNSLPANGGNADTVDGFGVAEYVTTLPEGEYYTEVARINTRGKKIESCDTSNLKVGLAESANYATNATNADTVNNHTVDSNVPANAVFTDTTNSDVMASGNPVQIDGLQGGVPFSEMVVSGKNLIPFPYYDGMSKTHNGITFTVNPDGSVTANGTATATAIFYISTDFTIKKGTYALSGCPKSTSETDYILQIATSDWSVRFSDSGNGNYRQMDNDINFQIFRIAITNGVTVDNVVFRPQLEIGTTATAYEPPITGRDLTVGVCGKNLLPYPYADTTKTVNGITFTDNGDGTITANGTATANTTFKLSNNYMYKSGINYVVSGCPNGDGSAYKLKGNAEDVNADDVGNGKSFLFEKDTDCSICILIYRNATVDNLVFRPQLELGSTATPYESYHGIDYTITPTSNPYTIPNDIRQQDGLNVVSVSEGELSVVGVQKNAAIKRIWDNMGMDLLFDGVTDESNPALIDIKDYSNIVVSVESKYNDDIINIGTIIMAVGDIITSISDGIKRYFSTGSRAAIINITGTINNCAIVFAPHNTGDAILNCKIYGIK